jgi:hypothetical protein
MSRVFLPLSLLFASVWVHAGPTTNAGRPDVAVPVDSPIVLIGAAVALGFVGLKLLKDRNK